MTSEKIEKVILNVPFFTSIVVKDDKSLTASCCKCNSTITASLKATSNLTRHLKTKHSDVFKQYENLVKEQCKRKLKDDNPLLTKYFKSDKDHTEQARVDELVANYIVSKMAPLSTVDDEDF